MTPEDYFKISQYVKREYNHYLMDFIRDENDVPMESFQQMQERIAGDYEAMSRCTMKKQAACLGFTHSCTQIPGSMQQTTR
jgi:hypothetical protein